MQSFNVINSHFDALWNHLNHFLQYRTFSRSYISSVLRRVRVELDNVAIPASFTAANATPFTLHDCLNDVFLDDRMFFLSLGLNSFAKYSICAGCSYTPLAVPLVVVVLAILSAIWRDMPTSATVQSCSYYSMLACSS